VDRVNASSVLELGCGEAIALQEATALLERRQELRGVSKASVCAAGINSLEHALKYAYSNDPIAMARARAKGSVMAGNTSRVALEMAARRRHVSFQPSVTPQIVHTDFRRAWPFAPGSFDLLLSQSALGKLKYPDEELPHLLDEALRVLRTGGVAYFDVINAAGPSVQWRATGLPGHETDTGVAVSTPDGWVRQPADERLTAWLAAHAFPCGHSDRCTPVEIGIGQVANPHVSSDSAVPLSRLPCWPDSPVSRGARLGAQARRCALSFYYGSHRSSYVLLHTFLPTAATVGARACETAAFASPVIGPTLRLLNGSFGFDRDRNDLMRVLRQRAAVLHEARAQGDKRPDDAFELPGMLSDRRMWAEAFVTALRQWVRGSTPAWSDVRVFHHRFHAGPR
jgi:SAM-dependent methyltransferase